VLLLDEPFGALDARVRQDLRRWLDDLHNELGVTSLLVTHDQEEALELSDRIVVMSEGRMEQVGTPFEIYNFPATAFVASFVGTLNLVSAHVIDASTGRLSLDGQEIRVSKVTTDSSADGKVTLALRPEGIALGARDEGSNRLHGTVEDINFLGSIVRIRVRLGEGSDGEPPSIIALDSFNEPHLKVPDVGEDVTISFPPEAAFVLGAARGGPAPTAEAGAEV
jgi:putative spermidine/putrescine transport system ATP-binding protein